MDHLARYRFSLNYLFNHTFRYTQVNRVFFFFASAGKGGKEDKDKEVDPTSIGPTTSISPTGRGPWWQIRLPGNIQPYHYDLTLHVDLNKPFVKGTVDIWINVSSSAPYILLHTRNMNFTRVEVLKVSGGESNDSV